MKTAKYFPAAAAHDTDVAAAAIRFGYYCGACAVAGLDPDSPHTSKEFAASNPFVHTAIRNGDITADLTTVSPIEQILPDGTRRTVTPPPDVIFKT